MIEQLKNKKWVHDQTEVKLTGRVATRKLKQNRRQGETVITVYEITPTDIETGSWKRWVRLTDLFEINE